VIAITLNFKTLDAALRVLREIPESHLLEVVEDKPAPKAEKPAKAPKAAAEPVAAPAPAIAQPEAAPAPAAAPATPELAAPAIDYATLQKAVFALAGKSREAAAAVAGGFGVKTFKELPQDKWGEALGAVQEKLAELENT
jgi:uncharacterized membrane protein